AGRAPSIALPANGEDLAWVEDDKVERLLDAPLAEVVGGLELDLESAHLVQRQRNGVERDDVLELLDHRLQLALERPLQGGPAGRVGDAHLDGDVGLIGSLAQG